MRCLAATCLTFLLVACDGLPNGPASQGLETSCDAARAVVELHLAERALFGTPTRPLVVDEDFGREAAPLGAPAVERLRRALAPGVPLALVQEMIDTRDGAVARCASLVAFLKKRGIASGRTAAQEIYRRGGEAYDADILGISLPVVSEDGREALVIVQHASGNEATSGSAVRLRRGANGAWAVAGRKGLWVS